MKLGISILKSIPLFSELSEGDLSKLSKIVRHRRFKRGEIIVEEEKKGSVFYLVLSGKVKVFQKGPQGKRKTLAILERGDFFGEMSLIDRSLRSANCEALDDSILLSISAKDFNSFIMKDNRVLIKITQALVKRLRKADSEIKALTFQSILERLIWKLLEISRLRRTSKIQLSLKELEEMIGSSREVISRAISRIIKIGVIEREGNKIIIKDKKKMKKLANF